MTDPIMQCPQCGGHQEKDLRAMRRITGWAVTGVSVTVLLLLALLPWRAPTWLLVTCAVLTLLGVVALLGAKSARYCAECDVRLEPQPRADDQGRN